MRNGAADAKTVPQSAVGVKGGSAAKQAAPRNDAGDFTCSQGFVNFAGGGNGLRRQGRRLVAIEDERRANITFMK